MITTLLALAAAAALIFGTLYFSRGAHTSGGCTTDQLARMEGAQQEIGRLRASTETMENALAPVTAERALAFLRDEKGWESEIDTSDGEKTISFEMQGMRYTLHTSRLPQTIISKGYNMEGSGIDWDALNEAALRTTADLVMVKFNIWRDSGYELYIVSHDYNMANFRMSLERHLDILAHAEESLAGHYRNLKEASGEVDPEGTPGEDIQEDGALAMYMSQESVSNKKIQS